MRKLIFLLALLCLSLRVSATDITIPSATIPFAAIPNLGSVSTGTATVSSGSATVTSSAAFPSRLVGLSGFQILLGSTTYTVASCDSTSSITLTANYNGGNGSVSYSIRPVIVLRLFATQAFVPKNASYVVQSGNLTDGRFYKAIACTVWQNQINIPSITLPATTDIENPSQQGARWSAYFFSLEGSRIRAYECFEEFSLSAGIATQEWTTICRYQSGLARALPDNATLTREQIYGLIGQNSISATPNYFVKGNPAGTGVTSAAAYESSGNVTFTGQTDLLGGIPQKTAAEIASLAGGAPGRVFYQTDGLKGFYRDYGAAVGVRHIGGYYDALELGFIPNDSSSGTRTANSALWSAVITALPATGEVIRFPSGSFSFATKLSSNKPVNIVGAGAAFVSGSTTTGTTLIVESGQAGIEFLAGAKSSSVENITIKTRSGISGQTTGDGIYSNATIKLKNVSIESFARYGVFLDSTVAGATTDFSVLERVDVWGTGSDGFRYDNQTDSNVITTTNCNATLVGRHGFYDGGASNVFIGCHVAYAGQIDATGKDYYENGNGNTWIRPYSESTASNKFYFGTSSTAAFLQTGTFGAPVVEFANSSIALAAHTIIEGNKQRDFWLTSRTSTALSPGDHDYSISSTNGNYAGEFLVFDQTAGQTAISYNPANRALVSYRMQPTNLAPVVVSPSQITSNQNNYAPTNGTTYRLSSDAARTITGWSAATLDGTRITLVNVGSYDITLSHESSSSTAANRFTTIYGFDAVLVAGGRAEAIYDTTAARWKLVLQ